MEGFPFNRSIPPTEHRGLAAAMYGKDFLKDVDGQVLNVAAGHTDLAEDLRARNIHADVISLDPAYKTNGLYNGQLYDLPDRVAGAAEDIPYEDNTFAVTLCQFGMQHIKDQGAALREMVRVTKPVDSLHDNSRGTILVNPVWDAKKLAAAIWESGLQDVCGIQDPPRMRSNKGLYPTLVIKKVPALDEAKLNTLVEAIAKTDALNTRRRIGAVLAKLEQHSYQ